MSCHLHLSIYFYMLFIDDNCALCCPLFAVISIFWKTITSASSFPAGECVELTFYFTDTRALETILGNVESFISSEAASIERRIRIFEDLRIGSNLGGIVSRRM